MVTEKLDASQIKLTLLVIQFVKIKLYKDNQIIITNDLIE